MSEWRNKCADGNQFTEPVLVFKHRDKDGRVIGGSVQGLNFYDSHVKAHASGHLKRILRNSGSYGGLTLGIGNPHRIIIFEASIVLMSYYQLHKESLSNVKLIATDGYKPQVISRYLSEIYGNPSASIQEKEDFLRKFDDIVSNTNGFPSNLFTFAYDNDPKGREFVERFKQTYPYSSRYIKTDFPPLAEGQVKNDWNDELKARLKLDI